MKKNTFYLLCGAAAILLVLLFNLSVELKLPWLIFVGIVAAVVAYIICRKKIAGETYAVADVSVNRSLGNEGEAMTLEEIFLALTDGE